MAAQTVNWYNNYKLKKIIIFELNQIPYRVNMYFYLHYKTWSRSDIPEMLCNSKIKDFYGFFKLLLVTDTYSYALHIQRCIFGFSVSPFRKALHIGFFVFL